MNEREKNQLDILAYALERRGVPGDAYFIEPTNIGSLAWEPVRILRKVDDKWHVIIRERGIDVEEGQFRNIGAAARFFFWRLTDADSHWRYREEFETHGKT